ncbi:Uncharacterised protein [Streptococcus pneumoniae]|nr:Uncharacterised protein [Streptococcus pneumoniae]
MKLTKSAQNMVFRTDEVSNIYTATLTWFEEIFKEYYSYCQAPKLPT